MKKNITVLIFFVIAFSYSQSDLSYEDLFNRALYSQKKPTPWDFQNYSKEGEVDKSTGRFNFKVDFTSIDVDNLTFPISLNYSTSGVKIDENASEIGMGWDLIAGGKVSRELNGVADEIEVPIDACSGCGTVFSDYNLFVKVVPEQEDFSFWQWRNLNSLTTKAFRGSATKGHHDYYSNFFPVPRIGTDYISPSDYFFTSLLDMLNNNSLTESQRDIFHVTFGDLNFHFMLKIKDEAMPNVQSNNNQIDIFDFEAIAIDDKDIKIDVVLGFGDFYYAWTSTEPGATRVRNAPQIRFIKGFVITDKRGVKYYFNDYTFTEPQYVKTLLDHSSYGTDNYRTIQYVMQDVQVNNWEITKVEFPSGKEINFTYLKNRISEEKIVPREHDGEYTGFPYNLRPQKVPYGINTVDFEYEQLYLEEIISDKSTIKFNYGSRTDLKFSRRLENIQQYDKNDLLVKQFDLVHQNYGADISNDFLSKRLFLKRIINREIDHLNNNIVDGDNDNGYFFEYKNPDNLPSKNAIGFQDLFGYYLGNSVEITYPPFPKLYINPNFEGNKISYYPLDAEYTIAFNGADRTPNGTKIDYGNLTNIFFPTGGSLEIDYEANVYYNSYTVENNLKGPGCRVKELKYFNSANGLEKIKRYDYNIFNSSASSGILLYKPSFAYIANYVIDNQYDLQVEQTHEYSTLDLPYNVFYKYSTTKEQLNNDGVNSLSTMYKKLITTSTHALGPQTDIFGREIIYTNVLEEDISNLDNSLNNGKIKYYNYYEDNRTEVNVISGPTDDFTYVSPGSQYVYSDGFEYPYWCCDESMNGYLKVSYGFIEKKGKDIFPFPKRNYFDNSGALKIGKTYKIEYLNNSEQKIKEFNYDYQLLSNSSYKSLNFKMDYLKTYYHSSLNNTRYNALTLPPIKPGLYFYTVDTLYTNHKLVLDKEEIIDYLSNGSIGKIVQKYYNQNFVVNNKTTTISTGDILETKYSYAPDISSVVNDLLVARNVIGVPLKTEAERNGEKLSTLETVFNDWGNGYLGLKLVKTSKGGDPTEIRLKYNLVDTTNGNPLEVQKEGGMLISYIWGYNSTQPVAKIENLAYGSIPVSLITAIQSATDAAVYNEQNVLSALDALRTDPALANAMVTTYTYKPLVGVSTITDPKGNKTTYHYDGFGRLQYVKDKDGNILSENEYHYRTQN